MYVDPDLEISLLDVLDSHGNYHSRCRMLDLGGGSIDSFDHCPPPTMSDDPEEQPVETTGDVLLLFRDGFQTRPFVIGTIYTPERKMVADEVITNAQNITSDYPETNGERDRIIKHKDVRLVFSSTGTWLLDLKTSDAEQQKRQDAGEPRLRNQPARVELDKNTWVRVSQEGTSGEYSLLGDVTLKHIRAIHGRLDALATKIEEVETHVQTVATSLTALGNAFSKAQYISPAGPLAPLTVGAVFSSAFIAYDDTEKIVTDFEDIWDFSKQADLDPINDGNSDKLKAGCFRISSRSVDDQNNDTE